MPIDSSGPVQWHGTAGRRNHTNILHQIELNRDDVAIYLSKYAWTWERFADGLDGYCGNGDGLCANIVRWRMRPHICSRYNRETICLSIARSSSNLGGNFARQLLNDAPRTPEPDGCAARGWVWDGRPKCMKTGRRTLDYLQYCILHTQNAIRCTRRTWPSGRQMLGLLASFGHRGHRKIAMGTRICSRLARQRETTISYSALYYMAEQLLACTRATRDKTLLCRTNYKLYKIKWWCNCKTLRTHYYCII